MVIVWIGAVWVILSVCLGLAWVLILYEKPKVPIPTPDPPRDAIVFQALKGVKGARGAQQRGNFS